MLAIVLTSSPTLTKLSSRKKLGLSADRHVRVVFLVGRGGWGLKYAYRREYQGEFRKYLALSQVWWLTLVILALGN